ncbi:MAG: ABC-F family ATP-binding cassette domain-containing protein [Anaerolineaceae bacterium]|nr:ABC-F family ATP-binding cassette domain-containing protein [Anaerolineaceae bacterium]
MPILSANNLTKSFGSSDIFRDVSFSIPHRARIGLVGPNGVGKTTLLRILLGLEDPSAGRVQIAKGVRLGYLPQNATLDSNSTVWEECLSLFSDLIAMQEKLAQLEQAMSAETNEVNLESAMAAYGKLQHEFERLGGYTYETRIRQTLTGLGFVHADFSRPLYQLSGGQRTRAFLARLLLSSPDLLLLDEPTNHLDIAAIEWLESYLREWTGGVLLISHDRYFLDQVVTSIIEMTPSVFAYNGNYSAYLDQRQARWERMQQIYESEKERLEKDLDYVKRNIAGQNVRQARGRLRRLSREVDAIERAGFEAVQTKNWAEITSEVEISEHLMGVEEVEKRIRALRLPSNRPPQLKLHLKAVSRSGDLVVRTHDLQVGYQDEGRALFSAPDLTLLRGECAGVIGPNGAGKSTFLKTLLGQLPPLAGEVTMGASLHVGYFAQAHEGLHSERTLMEEIDAIAPQMRPGEIRDYLARFLFTGDDVYKRVEMLSGGERGRLALACLELTQANLLLLDEPTNHLDIPSQEILQSVLSNFQGTILLVSHDRYLIDALATQIWEVDPDQAALRVYDGTYTEYKTACEAQAELEKQAVLQASAQAVKEQPAARPVRTGSTNKERQRRQRLVDIEDEIAVLEAQLSLITSNLEDPPADAGQVNKLAQEYERVQNTLNARMDEWAHLSEELAEIQ